MAEPQKPVQKTPEQTPGKVIKDDDKKVDPQKAENLAKIQEILSQYGGQESNIPTNHEYWDLVNKYRGQK